MHPKFELDDSEDDVLVYGEVHDYFDDEEETEDEADENNSSASSTTIEEPVDPRFAALLKLKNNNLQ